MDSKWQAPAPEDVIPLTWYTFNFNPKEQPNLQPINHVDSFGTNLQEWLTEQQTLFVRCKHCELNLYLEISRNGRFHFHGRIRFKGIPSIMYFYAVDIRRLQANGTYEIDTISDPMQWDLYCRKQQEYLGLFSAIECISTHINTNIIELPC